MSLKIVMVVLAGMFILLSFVFDIWVYRTTKDWEACASLRSRYPHPKLSPSQITLRKVVNYLQRATLFCGGIVVVLELIQLATWHK
jgi:preprotein translocase subunit SecG